MKTIAIIGQKGGTGKSTIAQMLAVAFTEGGFLTLGVDLDPQTSFCTWSDLREADEPAVIDTQHSRLAKTLDGAREQGVQVAIIDTAGRAEQAAMAAVKAADLVLIPVQPTGADLLTVEATKELVTLAGSPPHVAVITRVKPRGSRHDQAREFLTGLGIETCPQIIGDRVTYQDAGAAGLAPQEYDRAGKAAEESIGLYTYTRKKLGM